MSRSFEEFLVGKIPALAKVWLFQFGLRSVLQSAAWATTSLGLLLLNAMVLPARVGWVITAGVGGCACILAWHMRALDLVGKFLCASGCLRENLSRVQGAKSCFRLALRFLRDRQRAYEGLYRLAGSPVEKGNLARLIERAGNCLGRDSAALMGRCFGDAGDFEGAKRGFEAAERAGPSDEGKLELAQVLLKIGAADKCLDCVQRMDRADVNGHSFFLRAAALRALGKPGEALPWANRATQVRPGDPDYQLEKGRILQLLGRRPAARRQFNKSIRVHQRNPEAFFRRALLSLQEGEFEAAGNDLERCYYYENTFTEAYLLAHSLQSLASKSLDDLRRTHAPTWLQAGRCEFDLAKGDVASVVLVVGPESAAEDCRVVALEPFGAGLEVKPREVLVGRMGRDQKRRVEFQVKMKRASEVNLNRAWILNFVLISAGSWSNQLVKFCVRDANPGRIFLVLTNDHEPLPYRGEVRKTGKSMMLADAFERHLVRNCESAEGLANKCGFKWTHMLDAGGAVALPQWAGARDKAWNEMRDKAETRYRAAAAQGHDCQVHLHLSAVPESAFFCYEYDPDGRIVYFDLHKRDALARGRRVNSWANVVPRYGGVGRVGTRVGSLARAMRAISTVMTPGIPAYQAVFFRAGQWDLGRSVAEREKSILALREAGILADSSVTESNNAGETSFDFGRPPHRASYFTCANDPSRPADRLRDAGLLEVVPIVHPQGRHAVTPRCDAEPVIQAYRSFFENGRIKPGRHFIMEIEHLATVAEPKSGSTPGQASKNEDWKAMEQHFARISRECPALEGFAASEAIYSWLDYYSPEPMVRLEPPTVQTDETTGRWRKLRFPLRFLGDGILTDEEKVYILAVPLPVQQHQPFHTVRVLRENVVRFEQPFCQRTPLSLELTLSNRNRDQFVLELERN